MGQNMGQKECYNFFVPNLGVFRIHHAIKRQQNKGNEAIK